MAGSPRAYQGGKPASMRFCQRVRRHVSSPPTHSARKAVRQHRNDRLSSRHRAEVGARWYSASFSGGSGACLVLSVSVFFTGLLEPESFLQLGAISTTANKTMSTIKNGSCGCINRPREAMDIDPFTAISRKMAWTAAVIERFA